LSSSSGTAPSAPLQPSIICPHGGDGGRGANVTRSRRKTNAKRLGTVKAAGSNARLEASTIVRAIR
jgi:hypothetical protein